MRDGRLKPRFLSGSLCEPRPNNGDIQDAQVLEQNASTKAQGLNDKVIEKIIGRLGKVISQNCRDVAGSLEDRRDNSSEAGRDCRDQHKLNEEEGEIESLCDDLTLTSRGCAHEDC